MYDFLEFSPNIHPDVLEVKLKENFMLLVVVHIFHDFCLSEAAQVHSTGENVLLKEGNNTILCFIGESTLNRKTKKFDIPAISYEITLISFLTGQNVRTLHFPNCFFFLGFYYQLLQH